MHLDPSAAPAVRDGTFSLLPLAPALRFDLVPIGMSDSIVPLLPPPESGASLLPITVCLSHVTVTIDRHASDDMRSVCERVAQRQRSSDMSMQLLSAFFSLASPL